MFLFETILLTAALSAPQPQGCGHHRPPPGRPGGHGGHGQAEPDRPRTQATNTICPVMGRPLKPGRDREVVIRGNRYLVCCDGCGPEMAERPDKYLDQDGQPRNTPKESDGAKERAPAGPSAPERPSHQH